MPHPKGSGISGALNQSFGPRRSIPVSQFPTQGGGGGFGGGGGDFRNLFAAFQQQQSQFNQGAQARFAQVNRLSAQTRARALKANQQALQEARRVGAAQKVELGRRSEKRQAVSKQSLAQRGLGNTSIVESQERAIEGDFARQSRAIDEDVSRRRVGVLENRAGLEFGLGELGINTFLSRRDQSPNISQTLQLLQQLGGRF